MSKYCEECGAVLEDNAKVCPKCGKPVIRRAGNHLSGSLGGLEKGNSSKPESAEKTRKPFSEPAPTPVKSGKKIAADKIVMIAAAVVLIVAIAAAVIIKTGLLSKNDTAYTVPEHATVIVDDEHGPGEENQETAVPDADAEPSADTEIDNEEPSETQTAEEVPAEETAAETEKADESQSSEIAESTVVIDEEYVAKGWYTYYMSYLNAINHGGDVSYLEHVSDERKKSFVTNYEKYNKGYTFENISFDVDKTDMKLKDLGNGKIEATCHAYAVNVSTEIATGLVEDNRVTLLGKLQFDTATGDYVLMQQQGDNGYSFGKHEMIHCAD